MHVQLHPIAHVVLDAEVGVEGVRAGRVLSGLRADLEGAHALVEKHFEGRVREVLALQGQVRHDVPVVDHPYYPGHSRLHEHRQLLVA